MSADFSVDRAAVAVVLGLVFVAWPAVFGATLWKLGVFDPGNMGTLDVALAVGAGIMALVAPVHATRELSGALGLRIGEHGIAMRSTEIAWTEVTAIERPAFGKVVVRAGERAITVQTYLFRGRERLEQFITERAPGLG